MSFKVGDKVRCVKEDSFLIKKDSFLNLAKVNVGEVYTVVSCGLGVIMVKEVEGSYWMDCFELAFPPLPDHIDLAIPKQHICMPRNAGRNFAMEQIAGALFNKTGYIKVWNGKEWEWLAAPATHPTVTKIIHNGTTTITFFSDGKKVITRPSQDDVEKYDPFVGWCVGVVEHLYGGKEKAKKFYKKHAVVQKEAQAIASLNGNRRRGN